MLSMDKNHQLSDDHDSFLERKRLLFNQYQKRNRNKILKKSRQVFNSISQQLIQEQQNEEQELEDMIDAMEIEGCTTKQINSKSREKQEDYFQHQQQINENFGQINYENYSSQIFQNEQNAQPKLSKQQQRKIERDRLRSEVNLKLAQQSEMDSYSLMVQPQYMIEIPDDIDSCFFVVPKPSGKRCLVITKNQITSSQDKNGILIQNFQNFLPNGTKISEKQKFYSFLDCIYNEEQQTYYIMDIIIDNDLKMSENSTDMRFFWIQQNFSKDKFQDISDCDHFKFKFIPKFTCNGAGFEKSFQFKFDFMKEGILFIHKDGNQSGGAHHNFITWMDSNSTNNFLNKRIPLAIKQQQDAAPKITAYLLCDENYCLSTIDNYNLYQLDSEERKIYQIQPYMIVKIEIDSIKLTQIQIQLLQEFDQFPYELEKTNKNTNSIEEEIKLRKNWVFVEGLNILEINKTSWEEQSELINDEFEQNQCFPDSLSKLVNEYRLKINPNCLEQIQDKIELEIDHNAIINE